MCKIVMNAKAAELFKISLNLQIQEWVNFFIPSSFVSFVFGRLGEKS